MPEQFYAERALLGSDGISSGTPPGDARCYALRAFSSSPVLPVELRGMIHATLNGPQQPIPMRITVNPELQGNHQHTSISSGTQTTAIAKRELAQAENYVVAGERQIAER